jgi:2-polyprenyl-3-methyl-5-hydroxy-6-metoxy-1,4-benzoquinol methylase
MTGLQQKWDSIYRKREHIIPEPASVLSKHQHLLPTTGHALDLACGLGGNSFFLARHGLQVDAWDVSSVAIESIKKNSTEQNNINASVVDLSTTQFPADNYDVITVSRFLDRQITPKLISALKPNGLIFYQTFTLDKAFQEGPSNPKFLLEKGELLSLFSALSPIIYHEEGTVGDIKKGLRNEAFLIAQKPAR